MVADNVSQLRLLHRALKADKVIESLIVLGVFRSFPPRQHDAELVGDADRVYHFVLGIAWMHVASLERNLSRRCVEILKLKLAYRSAVHRVSPVGAETLHVKLVRAQTDFLIGIERDADVTVLDFRMSLQIFHSSDNLSDTRLVVGSEQRLAVGHDKVLTLVFAKLREIGRRKHHIAVFVEHDVAALVSLHDARVDVASRHVGRRVEMGDESHSRHFLVNVARKSGHQIAILVERYVFKPH